MSYLDRSSRNWSVLVATLIAVPALFVWALIEAVGGSLICAGVDGPCGATVVGFIAGVAAIGLVASTIGWLLNRLIVSVSSLRQRLA